MNKLCCLLHPEIRCAYCSDKWCSKCWKGSCFPGKKWGKCSGGSYPTEKSRGGHYTCNVSSLDAISFGDKVEKYRFKKTR